MSSGVVEQVFSRSSHGKNLIFFLLTPALELCVDLVDLPIAVNIIPCYQKDYGNYMCS